MNLIVIFFSFVLVNNFILSKFMGLCPFIGVSQNRESAVGMGFAVIFVMSISSLLTWGIYHAILAPLEIEFLKTIVFILVIASLVQLVELVIRKLSPGLYKALGIYLPLITTNCAVLGIAIISVDSNFGPLESFVAGMSGGIGFLMVLVIMSFLRQKLLLEKVPAPFRGVPIAFITAGAMALAFMAFNSSMISNLFPGV
ncbi:MAG: RnfABCDGE type electron transport complex subunit A [Spirochaetia bacterium]|nr:RnfABCDGE type electron transport complex subunit A [Spirochaetia bacterium]